MEVGHAVEVVLADEDDGKGPDGGDVERLVEGALVVGPVAEEADRHRAGAQPLGRERGADGDGQPAADDAVRAEIALGHVGDVHRPAPAPAIAFLLAEELREHGGHVGALGDAMAVAAMGGGDLVVVGQPQAGPHGGRLLPDRQVHGAVDQAARVAVLGPLLELADEIHLAQRALQRVGVVGPHGVGRVGAVGAAGSVRHGRPPARAPRRMAGPASRPVGRAGRRCATPPGASRSPW